MPDGKTASAAHEEIGPFDKEEYTSNEQDECHDHRKRPMRW